MKRRPQHSMEKKGEGEVNRHPYHHFQYMAMSTFAPYRTPWPPCQGEAPQATEDTCR